MAVRRRAFRVALATSVLCALAACGESLGDDDDPTAPPRPGADGGDGGPTTESGVDGSTDGTDIDGGLDGAKCSANGTLDFDPTFSAPGIAADQGKTALSASEVLGTVGKCRDGGSGLELARTLLDGSTTPASTCFGSVGSEAVESIAATSQGWAIASVRLDGVFAARAIHVRNDGSKIADDQLAVVTGYPASYARFALEVGGSVVWGGYRYGQAANGDRGFLRVMGAFVVTELAVGERPFAAAVSDGRLYVVIVRPNAAATAQELLVKRYDVSSGSLFPDATFSSGTPPSLAAASQGNFDPIGSILVENGVVTVAAGQGTGTVLLRLANGAWTQEVTGAIVVARIARSCDGSMIVGGAFDLDGSIRQAIVRRSGNANAGALAMPDKDSPVTALLRHPNGDLYVAQNPGSTTTIRRVLP